MKDNESPISIDASDVPFSEDSELALQQTIAGLNAIDVKLNPTEWADLAFDLSLIYLDRRLGDKNQNYENAVIALKNAASIYNSQNYPEQWARIMFELGSVYLARTKNAPRDNMKIAIQYFERALAVYRRDGFPTEWAECHRGIGKALLKMSQDSDFESRERALVHYSNAMESLRKEECPELWHTIQFEFFLCYRDRKIGDAEQNRCRAQDHRRLAFEFEKDERPELFAALRRLDELHAELKSTLDELAALAPIN